MAIFNYLQEKNDEIKSTTKQIFRLEELEIADDIIDFPDKKEFGDLSTNIAMILSKKLKQSPQSIAEKIVDTLRNFDNEYEKIEIVGSGFINFFIKKEKWLEAINKILECNINYGANNFGAGKKVNNEFCSANPTGPLHLGHIRGAVWGDVVSRIMKFCGYHVDNEYYINDLGGQIDTLIKTVFLRYKETFGEKITLEDGMYPGEYLIDVAKNLREKLGDSLLNQQFDTIKNLLHKPVIDEILSIIKNDLNKIGIKFDIWTYESEITKSPLMNEALEILQKKNLIYRGKLEQPKGEKDDEWEEKEQDLFKSTEFGDDVDRAMRRSDGNWAYFAKDVAYHLDKIKRKYDLLILEVGIDHNGYKKRMMAAVNALSDGAQKFFFEYHNMVYLLKNGEQQKMSKRSGKLIGVDEILQEMNHGVLRFYLMSKRHDVELEFDIEKINEASKNNPYFYIQYGHARSSSILRKAQEFIKNSGQNFSLQKEEFADIICKMNENEIKLVKKLIMWPKCVKIACEKLEPHRINFYLQELAAEFHNLWNLGNNDPALLFINKNDHLATKYRINLVKATQQVLANGLRLMGIDPLEIM